MILPRVSGMFDTSSKLQNDFYCSAVRKLPWLTAADLPSGCCSPGCTGAFLPQGWRGSSCPPHQVQPWLFRAAVGAGPCVSPRACTAVRRVLCAPQPACPICPSPGASLLSHTRAPPAPYVGWRSWLSRRVLPRASVSPWTG